jgi:CHAT domain-containing protein
MALANGENLTVQDLLALRFDADLVTMSASQTGLGVLTRGEEVVGLTRGLLAAGARCLVVTLWAVDDGLTVELMRHFYDHMKRDMLSPSRALRAAQCHVLKMSEAALAKLTGELREPSIPVIANHPRYGAGFQVVGLWPGE